MTDAISVTVTSLTTNPTITILSDKVPPSESVHKLCLTVNITGTLSGGKATAPAEMILQRTPTGTQLQQLSSKSFTGYVPLQNVGGRVEKYNYIRRREVETQLWCLRGERAELRGERERSEGDGHASERTPTVARPCTEHAPTALRPRA
jgi:hypothetical protein